MGYYVSVDMVREDDDMVVYRYVDDRGGEGEVEFNKRSGTWRAKEQSDYLQRRALSAAASRVHKNWVSGEPFKRHLDFSS